MRRLFVVLVMLCSLVPAFHGSSAIAQSSVSCNDYDAWEWAQSVYEEDESTHSALDPDGNGVACDELPHGGFAPALWTDSLPKDVEAVTLVRIVDGDTFEVLIDGVTNRVRIYRADTPETQNQTDCGGQQATDFTTFALSFNDNADGTVYLERDKTLRDKYGRELAYIWFEIGGKPYMLNELLIRGGWAEDIDYGDRKYDTELKDAQAFAKKNNLGVWGLCGDFGIPLADAPTTTQDQPTDSGNNGGGTTTEAPVVEEPVYEEPVQEEPAGGGCNPNYSPCVPNSPGDLDCKDIGFSVTVIGYDQYNLDADSDGAGCESY